LPGPRGPGARRRKFPSSPNLRLPPPQAFRCRPVPQCGSRKRPLCLPKKPAPEGRHSDCRGRQAPGLEGVNLPPLLTSGGRHHRHFDVVPYHKCGSRKRPLCLPKKPAPEGRHSGCRGREAPGLEGMKFPPIPAGCYSHRHFDVVPYHNVGLVNDLSVYPKNQPRRGDIVPAGAARPRGSME
jgi:hypothetical protein